MNDRSISFHFMTSDTNSSIFQYLPYRVVNSFLRLYGGLDEGFASSRFSSASQIFYFVFPENSAPMISRVISLFLQKMPSFPRIIPQWEIFLRLIEEHLPIVVLWLPIEFEVLYQHHGGDGWGMVWMKIQWDCTFWGGVILWDRWSSTVGAAVMEGIRPFLQEMGDWTWRWYRQCVIGLFQP